MSFTKLLREERAGPTCEEDDAVFGKDPMEIREKGSVEFFEFFRINEGKIGFPETTK